MRVMRFMHDHGVRQEAQRAIALASYHHAQANPRAVMHGRPLTAEAYDASRWIVEPFRLFDCCMENDGAAALVLVSAERARDLRRPPAYLLGVAQGSEHRNAARGHNAPVYASSSFTTVAPHLWEMAGLGPKDVDVVQSYENFTGGVLMSLVEHGFFAPEEANDFLTPENLIAPARPAAAQHQRRQSRRVLHARARAADRGGAPAPRRVDQPGARARGPPWSSPARW